MKTFLFITIFVVGLALPASAFAQGMMGFSNSSPDSASLQNQQQEEQEGKQFLDGLNNKTVTCSKLNDADFEKIGEYVMGQSIGDTTRHIAMNEMMKRMMGDKGEEQMHTLWGKRGSGCDSSTYDAASSLGVLPMMDGWNYVGWWIGILLLMLGVLALFRYLGGSKKGRKKKSS
ncbi:hypothetical protein HY949_03135 [Candidatus Gottesmanbacteria bacterium]|nr:hypothetical protein [Candidatus Gottesmanbacteria bacterium]